MSSIDKARLVSPTLRRHRSRSNRQAVGTRERMARAIGEKKVQISPGYLARAEPFLDECLAGEGKSARGWGPWIAALLVCASIATGIIIVSALQST